MNRYCYLFVIDKCNMSCPTCANKYIMPKYTGMFDIKILKSYDLSGHTSFFITGGEPGLLSVSDKNEIVEYLENTYPETKIEVFTNGTNIHHWSKKITKLIHVINLTEPLIEAENSTYVIVVNANINRKYIIDLVSKYNHLKFNIKNDCYEPINFNSFDKLVEEINNNHTENIKIEKETNKCYKLPNKPLIFNSKISLTKKCSCYWFNCLNDKNTDNT